MLAIHLAVISQADHVDNLEILSGRLEFSRFGFFSEVAATRASES